MTDNRARLIETGSNLMWRGGYSAVSPRDVIESSGVGQGSFYHHFPTKVDLGVAAINANAAAIVAGAERALRGSGSGTARLRRYLMGRRDALLGCRIGGLTYDSAVIDDARLREPIDAAFRRVGELVEAAIEDAQQAGDVRSDIAAADLAAMVVAVVQGGYVLARAQRSPSLLRRAVVAAYALLDARGTGE